LKEFDRLCCPLAGESHKEKGPGKDPYGINHPNEYQHVHFEETRG
jgi:hypothetical protein